MYKVFGAIFVVLVGLSCHAQVQIPIGGTSSGDSNRKTARITSRILIGTITEKGNDKPISEAIVYLKNTKTLAVKTYISQSDGTYRFPELSPNVDYDIYAQKDGKKSSTKTLSQFDDRGKATINLQIDTSK